MFQESLRLIKVDDCDKIQFKLVFITNHKALETSKQPFHKAFFKLKSEVKRETREDEKFQMSVYFYTSADADSIINCRFVVYSGAGKC